MGNSSSLDDREYGKCFLESGYNLGGRYSPNFSIGDWKGEGFQEDVFINAVWFGLQGQSR